MAREQDSTLKIYEILAGKGQSTKVSQPKCHSEPVDKSLEESHHPVKDLSLTPDMGNLITNILGMTDSKKPSPK